MSRSYTSPFKSINESDQKDLTIRQLTADNYELRLKEKDYNILNSRLSDLEYRFKLLQDEKKRMDLEARSREGLQLTKGSNLDLEIRKLNATLADHELGIKQTNVDLATYKRMVDDKNMEIARLKKELQDYESDNVGLYSSKKNTENDLLMAKDSSVVAKIQADKLAMENERLQKDKLGSAEKLRGTELEVARMKRKIEDAELELHEIQSLTGQRQGELKMTREASIANKSEGDKLLYLNNKLQDEKAGLTQRIAELEQQISVTSRGLDYELYQADVKDKELRSMKAGMSIAESKGYEEQEELRQLQKKKETLEYLLDKYRGDVEIVKKQASDEAMKKLQLSAEKKRLERETASKDMEARKAQLELERAKEMQDSLLEDKMQLSQELDAVRGHADVLESQNVNLNRELDQFAETNERARRELDRKDRVEYLRNKNDSEYQMSMSKVISSSPGKSPLKSPYKSPYKSPSKY